MNGKDHVFYFLTYFQSQVKILCTHRPGHTKPHNILATIISISYEIRF